MKMEGTSSVATDESKDFIGHLICQIRRKFVPNTLQQAKVFATWEEL